MNPETLPMEKLLRPVDVAQLLNLKECQADTLRKLYKGFPPPVAEKSTAKKKLYRQSEIEAWAKQADITECIRAGYREKNKIYRHSLVIRKTRKPEPLKNSKSPKYPKQIPMEVLALFRDLLSGKLRPEGYVPKRIY